MNAKRVITIILFILTLVIGGVVAYFGYKLATEKTQAPTSTSAATCTDTPGCQSCHDDNTGGDTCNACCAGGSMAGTCGSDSAKWTQGWNQCNGNTGACAASSISADKSTFTLNGNCSNVNIDIYKVAYTGTNTKWYPDCITTSSTPGVVHTTEKGGANQTFNSYAQGFCQQIDAGSLAGVCRCEPPAAKKACNTSCSRNSDCVSGYCYKVGNSTTGKCRNSKCTTETDCTCNTITATCGDAKCNTGEACEATTSNGSTFKLCTTADITATRAPTGSAVTSCSSCAVSQSCGDTCTADSDCSDGTFCNGVTINDERYPDHMCILSVCNDPDATCKATGCQVIPPKVLPHTAIINKQADWVIGGIIALLTGALLLRFDVIGITKNSYRKLGKKLQTGGFAYLTAPVSTEAKTELTNKKKKSFEEKMSKK